MPPKGSYLENVYSLYIYTYVYGEQAHVASQQKTKKERSSGLQSSWKGKENHVKCDSSWNGTNLKRFHLKCEGSWKGQFLNKNHIKYDGSWKGENRKKNHIKCESSWKGKLPKKNRSKYDGSWKGQIWIENKITASVKVPDKETFWKEMASNIVVLEKDKSGKISPHQMWKFLEGKNYEKK